MAKKVQKPVGQEPSNQDLRSRSKINNKIFISWSGDVSKRVAQALDKWLPEVVEGIEPWISTQDISAGVRWGSEIARQLERINFGIICLTPDNLQAPWILFEAGALAKPLIRPG